MLCSTLCFAICDLTFPVSASCCCGTKLCFLLTTLPHCDRVIVDNQNIFLGKSSGIVTGAGFVSQHVPALRFVSMSSRASPGVYREIYQTLFLLPKKQCQRM